MTLILVGVGASVALGAALQRISGMGMGLIAAPILALLLGPIDGVLVVNVIAVINATLNTRSMRADIDWKKFAPIAGALIFGVIPGAWVIPRVSTDALQVLIGVLLIIALSVVTLGKRKVPHVEGVVPAAIAGAVGGFMNTLSGVAGPAITVYSQAARWDQRMYAATLQPIFLVAGALSFAGKETSGAADIAAIDPAIWVSTIAGLVVGVIVGKRLAPRVPKERARRIALSLAFLGGLTALVRGVIGLAG